MLRLDLLSEHLKGLLYSCFKVKESYRTENVLHSVTQEITVHQQQKNSP